MNSNRTTAILVGAGFLISNITFILGAGALLEPLLSSPDTLAAIAAARSQVVLGVLLELINGLAYIGIGVLMFPILRRRHESMALGYFGFRILEFVAQMAAGLSPLILVSLGLDFASASAADAASLQTAGAVLLAERAWAFHLVSLTFGLGALLFYIMLYRTKLIPRFISIWGLVGALAVLANAVLEMFGFAPGNLGILMLLNEVFLGLWLIVKGFNASAAASAPTD
ncbi:MAG: DUF4386 domain-containing protein [Anaerolineae bacterium]|nr:DUF4386 domain-containing protein [Anaerolineae bacterium]